MAHRSLKIALTLGLAATLWVMPSVGTQGMGTIGAGFTHTDRALLDDPRRGGGLAQMHRQALRRADAIVETALGL